MAAPYSNDLRDRIGAAVRDGYTVREAADLFDVSAATAARCGKRFRENGSAAAKTMGGTRRDVLGLDALHGWLHEQVRPGQCGCRRWPVARVAVSSGRASGSIYTA